MLFISFLTVSLHISPRVRWCGFHQPTQLFTLLPPLASKATKTQLIVLSQHILMYTLSHKMMVAASVLLLMERQTSQHHQTDSRIQNWKTLYKTLFNKHLAALHFQLSKVLGTLACHSSQTTFTLWGGWTIATRYTPISARNSWCHLLMIVLAHMNLLHFSTSYLPLHAYTHI